MAEQRKLHFKIHGMDCAEEVAILKREIAPLVGGESHVSFDLVNSRMVIAPNGITVRPEAIVAAVARTGMRAEWLPDERPPLGAGPARQRRWRTSLMAISGALLLFGFLSHARLAGSFAAALGAEELVPVGEIPLVVKTLYGLSILAGGWYVLPKAWRALYGLRPDMNLLMTIAVAGAIGIGEWFEAATVTFLFALSLTLESWSIGRARKAVQTLMELTPPVARWKREDGREEVIPAEQMPVGAIFVVRPGERFPLDGRIVRGNSYVNQAPITGESVPVWKCPGDEVFAGTVNGDSALEVQCTKPAPETTLAHIIRMVSEAQARRAPSEKWVDQFARVYTPIVLALAVAVLLFPPLLLHGTWSQWIYRSLVLLVIACPCALVISTPVSIVAAITAAARRGVLIKGGMYVEAPARLRAVAFDKTGTLTEGRLAVVEVVPLDGHHERELLQWAAALEMRSDHPIARAIVAYAEKQGVAPAPADDFQLIPGKGAIGRVGGQPYWLGSHRYLVERGLETNDVRRRLEAIAQAGRTVIVIGDDTHVGGLIALADSVRPEAPQALRELRAAGVDHLVLLTGDNRPTADAIARQTGVDEVHAELLPADKVRVVEELVARFGQVAMVGDGVNDAPALARATVGIAMGAIGSDAAIETADIALMSDDLSQLPWLVRRARRTMGIIRQNITFALVVKALFVILTFLGFASLWAAIAADMGASLLVIFNALRLLKLRH